MIDQSRMGLRCAFCWLAVIGMGTMLIVASCTSNQEFNYLYVQITELLSLSKTSWSSWLLSRSWFGHFLGYALLTVVLSGVFSFYLATRNKLLIAPVVAGLFGLLMEFSQIFIPSRGASLIDMGVNVIGTAIGLGVYLLVVALIQGRVWKELLRQPSPVLS